MSTDDGANPQLDLGEEVSRLAEAFQGWWSSSSAAPEDEQVPHDWSSCRICPLCRAMDVVRAVSPDVLQRVATAAETVAVLLREAAREGAEPERDAGGRDAWG